MWTPSKPERSKLYPFVEWRVITMLYHCGPPYIVSLNPRLSDTLSHYCIVIQGWRQIWNCRAKLNFWLNVVPSSLYELKFCIFFKNDEFCHFLSWLLLTSCLFVKGYNRTTIRQMYVCGIKPKVWGKVWPDLWVELQIDIAGCITRTEERSFATNRDILQKFIITYNFCRDKLTY